MRNLGLLHAVAMQRFPIAAAPETPGIYALKNAKTGQIYIGQSINLRRRYAEWKGAFVHQLGIKSKQLLAAIKASAPADREFIVLLELPGASDEDLAQAEEHAIKRTSDARPKDVLNVIIPCDKPKAEGNVAKSSIIDES